MAQIKSQMKRIITNEKAREANASEKSEMRTAIKKLKAAVAAKNKDEANKLLPEAVKLIDKAYSSGLIKANSRSTKKSQLMKLVNSLNA